ncbi:GNAT family N-acetyltransferase [Aquipuribacter sp. MA13-6]|uniref:GNAT family N-acetyltransferase n=1 Tax=unclassified Aquipuribacter TaxID=2635084 RepID=UPI003EEA2031
MTGAAPGRLVGRSWREAVVASGRDAYVTHHLAPAAVREVRSGEGWWAVGYAPTSYFSRGGLHVGGDVARVGEVVEDLCRALRPHEVTVDAAVPLPFAHPEHGSLWAWLHTTSALPIVPGEDRVRWDPDPVRLDELLDEANPDAYVRPGSPGARSWAAVADEDGRLLACGAVTEHTPGVPHLSSIAVSPAARRQGLGAALTVGMTRRLLRTAPAVSLALWSGNTVARALYDRIGFTGGHDYATRELPA